MDGEMFALWLVLPLLLLAEAALILYGWQRGAVRSSPVGEVGRALASLYDHRGAGIAALVVLWLTLTAIAWVYEFVVAFVAVHVLLFSLGRLVAAAGAILFAVLFLATPPLLGWLILNLARHRAAVATHLPKVRA